MDCVDDMDDLTSRVHDLPPELFSRIYEFVTAIEPKLIVKITSTYRPPAILQLDHSSREELAKQYYGRGTVFRFANDDQNIVLVWLRSIPTRFRFLIRRVEVGHEQNSRDGWRKVNALAREAKYIGLGLNEVVFWATFGFTIERTENRRLPRLWYRWTAA